MMDKATGGAWIAVCGTTSVKLADSTESAAETVPVEHIYDYVIFGFPALDWVWIASIGLIGFTFYVEHLKAKAKTLEAEYWKSKVD